MTATGKAPSIFAFMPTAPHYVLDWDGMTNAYKWVLGMKGSTQDPVHHNEGDVWIHTRMVVEQLVNLPQWRTMRTQDQLVTFMAAVLHDVAKPATRKVIEGRIRNPRHSDLGSCDARAILWKMGVPWHLREQVAAIIKVHQVPFWLIESPEHEARRHLIRTSLFVENRLLYLVAQADMLGRRAADQARILDNIALFKVAAEELKSWDTPFPFFNAKTRLEYFYAPGRIDPSAELFDTTSEEFVVTLTSGLPGSGKSTWARDESTGTGKPVISLDKIRRELGVDPDDNQGTVVQAAKHAMEVLLRNKQSFIFDATNLKKDGSSLFRVGRNDFHAGSLKSSFPAIR